jgi:hypothetical protein
MMVLLIFGICFGVLVWLSQHFPVQQGGAPRIITLRLTLYEAKDLLNGKVPWRVYRDLHERISDADRALFPRLLSWIFRPKR